MDRPISEEVKKERRRKLLLKIAVTVAVLVCVIAITPLLFRTSVSLKDLSLAKADRGSIETTINALGKVEPAYEQLIVSPISTRIVDVYCRPGDSLSAGTPIMLLDLADTKTSLAKAEDQHRLKELEIRRKELDNSTSLSDLRLKISVKEMEVNALEVTLENEIYLDSIGSGTGERVREAQMKLETERLQLQQLREQLRNNSMIAEESVNSANVELSILSRDLADMQRKMDDAKIKSPRGATLTFVNDQIGAQVSAGEHIATIADLSHFRISGQFAEGYLDRIAIGSRIKAKVGKKEYDGKITNISPNAAEGMVTFNVALDVSDSPGLRAGLKTDIYIMTDVIDDVIRIRRFPLFKKPGSYELFVLTSDNELTRRTITLGDSNWEYIEVVSGLAEGEQVVVSDMEKYNSQKKLNVK